MDEDVLAAMARWPGVPHAHGWLSLDPRGHWRLHPLGDAAAGGPGTSISNPAILAFIGRNYGHDEQGRWFFQNGPQRVFVRLDAAPWILRQVDAEGRLATHTGLAVTRIERWALDAAGRMYAATEHGPGMIEDRDLPAVLEHLRTETGASLMDALEERDAETGAAPGPAPAPASTSASAPTPPPASAPGGAAAHTPAVRIVHGPTGGAPAPLEFLHEPAARAFGFVAHPNAEPAQP